MPVSPGRPPALVTAFEVVTARARKVPQVDLDRHGEVVVDDTGDPRAVVPVLAPCPLRELAVRTAVRVPAPQVLQSCACDRVAFGLRSAHGAPTSPRSACGGTSHPRAASPPPSPGARTSA